MALQYETTKEHTITVTGYEGTIRHMDTDLMGTSGVQFKCDK